MLPPSVSKVVPFLYHAYTRLAVPRAATLKVALLPGGTVLLAGILRIAGSPPVTYVQLVPTRSSSIIPDGPAVLWQLRTNEATPVPLRVVLPLPPDAVTESAGGKFEPKLSIGGLIQRLQFVTEPATS